ncbi:MAG TPA: hypothetical protein VF163_05680 [Micromonosporaceae bacterium]
MGEAWTPELQLRSGPDHCRLSLAGITQGHGATLQEAANDLLVRVYDLALGLRRSGFRITGETGRPDPRVVTFLWEVGEIAVRGGDIRARVFGDGGLAGPGLPGTR